ncbi:DUF481 domain-containing protein [Uliginosibacterium sp. H1]|uniref:DUF481 domain-containing protein n=1 Tax=Uliginosibacterium sp. H1 TaxID=3114757 RepID=UPI002E173B03|nr:DUF481 domain-containing protein [Uliginosibacterium sp. H1]
MRESILLRAAVLAACLAPLAGAAQPTDKDIGRYVRTPSLGGDGTWNGSLGLGFTINRGNNNSTQGSLFGDATRSREQDRAVFRGLAVRNSNKGQTTDDNANLGGRYERNMSEQTFGYGDILFERDARQDLELRQSYSTGLGYRLVRTDRNQLNLYAGVGYVIEDNDVKPNESGLELQFGEDFAYALTDSSKITQRFIVVPKSVGQGGARYAFQIDLSTKIVDKLGLQLSALQKYRENVLPNQKKSDLTIFTGVTAKF